MIENLIDNNPEAFTPGINAYQAPAIEMVLTSDELDREVHYAGVLSCVTCGWGSSHAD